MREHQGVRLLAEANVETETRFPKAAMNALSLKNLTGTSLSELLDEVLVGQIARRQAITNPENTVYSIKRFMGRRYDEVSEEMGITPSGQRRSNLPLLQSVAFENQLLTFMLTSVATEEAHYQPLLVDLRTILRLIQADLE